MTHTLAQLQQMKPGGLLVQAVTDYISAGEQKIREARKLRDDAVRGLLALHSIAATARITGLNVATVRAIKGRP